MSDPLHGPSPSLKNSPRARLDSWKEIADYLGKAERTVKRWETERSLPIHRLPGGGHATVYAFTDELDSWLLPENKSSALVQDSPNSSATIPPAVPSQMASPFSQPPPNAASVSSRTPRRVLTFLLVLVLVGLCAAYLLNLHTSAYTTSLFYSLLGNRTPKSSDSEKQLAHGLYLRGRFEWDKRTPDSLNRALDYFTQSIVHDPSDAQAYVGLADTYLLLREYALMPENEAYDRAISAAHKALQLDDNLAEAHRSLAFALVWGKWDFVEGEKEFQRAIQLNPNDPITHLWFANSFAAPGWFPTCLREIDRAQDLNPSSHAILADKGFLLFQSGQTAPGLDLVKQVAQTDPNFLSPHRYLAYMYWAQRDYPKFLSENDTAAELSHDEVLKATNAAARAGFNRDGELGLFHDLYMSQKKFCAEGRLPATFLARTCARMGKHAEALRLLREDYEQHIPVFLMIREDLDLRLLKDEPEFQALLAPVNPPPPAASPRPSSTAP